MQETNNRREVSKLQYMDRLLFIITIIIRKLMQKWAHFKGKY